MNFLRQRTAAFEMLGKKLIRSIVEKKSFFLQMSGSAVLSGTSDFLCQKFVEKREKVDFARVGRFAFLISCCIAPIAYKWIHFIEKKFPAAPVAKNSSFFWNNVGKLKAGLPRVVLDQLIAAPILTSIFLFSLNGLESRSIATARARTAAVYWTVLQNNWKVWPFVQLINLTFVPIQYRVLLVQFVSLFWNIYLSHVQHLSKKAAGIHSH
uniref:Uncharacterized protein n=1 Tax=Panagrolaimus sp. PS1159 TaxID=55785 RepID=A0AC35G661_9BILA